MSLDISLDQVVERLSNMEKEVQALRDHVKELSVSSKDSPSRRLDQPAPKIQLVDKVKVNDYMKDFLERLGIKGSPIEALQLQEMMAKSGLEPNELTRDLIAAREE